MKTGNCEVRTRCQVAEIMLDEKGRATGVKYFDANNKGQVQTADVVVVAGSATETARLLLNSRSKLFPEWSR
jgi:choline dehydrogenase-like flavoprotein